jgi:hypothetical protein
MKRLKIEPLLALVLVLIVVALLLIAPWTVGP